MKQVITLIIDDCHGLAAWRNQRLQTIFSYESIFVITQWATHYEVIEYIYPATSQKSAVRFRWRRALAAGVGVNRIDGN